MLKLIFLISAKLILLEAITYYELNGERECKDLPYNNTYPMTTPIKMEGAKMRYRIAIITDKDKLSKESDAKWICRLRMGWLEVEGKGRKLKVNCLEWDEKEITLNYDLNQKGRAMEMSELVTFNGKLYTCDDRTGIVYELIEGSSKPIPFVRLNDGDGTKPKGFKCEWMTVKDNLLYVGSAGMEWVNKDGSVAHKDMFWVKTVNVKGTVEHHDWFEKYDAIRKSVGYDFPGYFFYEAVNWSDRLRKWLFLPRKGRKEGYDEEEDETSCDNKLFIADEEFRDIQKKEIGVLNKTQGFSSFKFIPGSKSNAFLALKTVEVGKKVETYIGAFSLKGKVLFELQKVVDDKYEGLEFI